MPPPSTEGPKRDTHNSRPAAQPLTQPTVHGYLRRAYARSLIRCLVTNMSVSVGYFKRFWRALDRFGAALFYNIEDITISSLCWAVRNEAANITARHATTRLRLYGWQERTLLWMGNGLEFFWPGHCEGARISDIGVANNTKTLLEPWFLREPQDAK